MHRYNSAVTIINRPFVSRTLPFLTCPVPVRQAYSGPLLWILIFHSLAVMSIDSMDAAGEHQLGVDATVFKSRLAADGRPIDMTKLGSYS